MTDHAALLRTIATRRRDDTPRLAFADWLEEHDQPDFARFIRTEIDVYRRPEWDAGRARYEHAARTDPRWERGRPWLREFLPELTSGLSYAGRPRVRRGFPWCLAVRNLGPLAVRHLDAVAAYWVERVDFLDVVPDLLWLAGRPWLAALRGVVLGSGWYTAAGIAPFLNDRRVAGLEELEFRYSGLSAGAVVEVFGSRVMPNLTRLSFTGLRGDVGRAILDGLRDAAATARLRTLELRGSLPGGPDGVARLAAGRLPAGVVSLSLAENGLNADRVATLAASRGLANLRVLDLSENHVGNAGAAALAASPHLGELRVLRLGHAMVGDEGIRSLLLSPLADRLVLLDLTGCPASAETKRAVKDALGDRVHT